jgi:hypothetical protein
MSTSKYGTGYNAWQEDNGEYVVRLTQTLIGWNYLREWDKKRGRDLKKEDLPVLVTELSFVLQRSLVNMSNETLGRIIGYATPHGYHVNNGHPNLGPWFLSHTGLRDIGFGTTEETQSLNELWGRDLLLVTAKYVLISIAADIIKNDFIIRHD